MTFRNASHNPPPITGRVTSAVDSPIGWLGLAGTKDVLTGVAFLDGRPADVDEPTALLDEVAYQLRAYFAGELTSFELPLAPHGSDFQRRVWSALCDIPYGETASYGDIARRLSLPAGGARAVGVANATNPIAIVVPCHRVVGADGTLTGYAGGLARKRFLLDLESVQSPQQPLFSG